MRESLRVYHIRKRFTHILARGNQVLTSQKLLHRLPGYLVIIARRVLTIALPDWNSGVQFICGFSHIHTGDKALADLDCGGWINNHVIHTFEGGLHKVAHGSGLATQRVLGSDDTIGDQWLVVRDIERAHLHTQTLEL